MREPPDMHGTAERTLSARDTPVMKFVFPTVWITGFGLMAMSVLLGRVTMSARGPFGLSARWGLPLIWVAVSIPLATSCVPLKRVRLAGRVLLISNYVREIRVPLSDVVGVNEHGWSSRRAVSIAFRAPTAFGQRIIFLPRSVRGGWLRGENPLVEELRALALEAGGASTESVG